MVRQESHCLTCSRTDNLKSVQEARERNYKQLLDRLPELELSSVFPIDA